MKISKIAYGNVKCQAIVPKYGLRGYSPEVYIEGIRPHGYTQLPIT